MYFNIWMLDKGDWSAFPLWPPTAGPLTSPSYALDYLNSSEDKVTVISALT
jgi:hypothetical protein